MIRANFHEGQNQSILEDGVTSRGTKGNAKTKLGNLLLHWIDSTPYIRHLCFGCLFRVMD